MAYMYEKRCNNISTLLNRVGNRTGELIGRRRKLALCDATGGALAAQELSDRSGLEPRGRDLLLNAC